MFQKDKREMNEIFHSHMCKKIARWIRPGETLENLILVHESRQNSQSFTVIIGPALAQTRLEMSKGQHWSRKAPRRSFPLGEACKRRKSRPPKRWRRQARRLSATAATERAELQ